MAMCSWGHRKSEGDPDRSAAHGSAWQLPQGGIDKGEDPLGAALRELHEETNMTSVSLLAEAPEWIHYDLPDDLIGIAFKGEVSRPAPALVRLCLYRR